MTSRIKLTTNKLEQEINLFEPGRKMAGIDIGNSSIKIAVLKEAPIGTRLLHLALTNIPPGKPDEKEEDSYQRISAALKSALTQLHVRISNVNTIISAPSLTVKNLSLPAMPDEELRESVKWEMEQNVNFAIDAATVDFLISGESVRAGARNLELEVVAGLTEEIKNHMNIYLPRQLKIASINIPAFCLWNVFQKSNQWKENDTIALLDIGSRITRINIFSNNILRFTREIFFGGETITDTLVKEAAISLNEAEEAKTRYGLSDTAVYSEIIRQALKQLVAQIDRSFAYYKAQFHIERIDRLILYGGTAKLINIDKFLNEELGIFAEIGTPFNGLLFDQKALENAEEISAFFAQAIGAALNSGAVKRINLLPAEFRKDTTKNLKKTLIKVVPAVVIAALLFIYLGLTKTEKTLSRDKTEKEAIINAWKSQQELERKLKFLHSIGERQKLWVEILRGISANIPEGVWLNTIKLDEFKKSLSIQGTGANNMLVIEFVRKLEALPYFSTVKLESVEERGQKATPLIYFKIAIGER
ncbi:MAG: type IV pilus assembly protein PilM [Candidatus Omnitrophica bacterium]|nr:type IV pilus assembly protein PilM [Candidatus Omnitrophota bacterium]MBU4478802.1 type IV pilus assembly protein PilM [Candidatus Omnitrophota bacterium]MCG2702873.1 type IV pilus assembly protein PilM [Candidatus Omnitrophota bacterium]